MALPFPPGEAWQVVQGYDDPSGSHKGYASFCWDFILADQPEDYRQKYDELWPQGWRLYKLAVY